MKTIAKMAKTNKLYKGIKTGRYFSALIICIKNVEKKYESKRFQF